MEQLGGQRGVSEQRSQERKLWKGVEPVRPEKQGATLKFNQEYENEEDSRKMKELQEKQGKERSQTKPLMQ